MSGGYTYAEEWQRRKSVLIRSLFHDISIPSTVEEESRDSSHDYNTSTHRVFPSPPRSYSPLPPLIIERIPFINKHDEPEEYYMKLHRKIKRLYRKLFIEKRNLSSIGYNSNSIDTLVSDESVNSNSGSVENLNLRFLESISPKNRSFDYVIEGEARQSSGSTKSTGYGEESDDKNLDEDDISYGGLDIWRPSEHKIYNTERIDDEASSKEQSSTINDEEMTEVGQSHEEEESNHENIDEHEIKETDKSDKVLKDNPELSTEDSHHSRNHDQEMDDSQDSSESGNEPRSVKQAKTDLNSHNAEPITKRGEETRTSEGRNESIASNTEPMEEELETSTFSDGPVYQQITTEALVHVDGSKNDGDRESRIYEDSVKSVILPTRFKRVVSHHVDDRIEVLTVLEEKDDPKPGPKIDSDDDESTEDFEEIRTHQASVSDEQCEEMRISPPDDNDEDTGAMRTSTHKTKEKKIQEMRTLELDVLEKKSQALRVRQTDSFEKDTKEAGTHRSIATEKIIEEIRSPREDTLQDADDEMSTHTLETTDELILEITTVHPDATNAKARTHQPEAYEEEDEEMESSHPIEQMRTPRRDLYSGTIPEAMSSHTPETTDELITEITIIHQDTTNVEEKTHQPEAYEEEDEERESPHQIEQMRTPRRDLYGGTIPVTRRSSSESINELTGYSREATALTSSSQDVFEQNISELQTTNDMNDILTSIFNESRSKNEASASGRKRKLVDKSVQAVPASRVTWEEMRANFFVGTPKIFRLCDCTDHVCN